MPSISERILSQIYGWYIHSFFKEVALIGGENVPSHGPVIICCTHPNSLLDPILLSECSPNRRKYHFWTLASMFSFPPFAAILRIAGCLPVASDFKGKHEELFKDTFELLTAGSVVALFPEGASHSEPSLLKLKDGASWAALEYARHIRQVKIVDDPDKLDVKVVVGATTYTDKTAYRSRAIIQYSKPLDISSHIDNFLSCTDRQTEKDIVKVVTNDIRNAMLAISINAPDKDTLELANLARQILWMDDDEVPLSRWTAMTQSLVDLFSEDSEYAALAADARKALSSYKNALRARHLSLSSLTFFFLKYCGPAASAPRRPAYRTSIAKALWSCTPSFLLRLPLFIIPAIVHIPAYITCLMVERSINKTMPEQLANVKIQYSALVLVCFVYPASLYLMQKLCRESISGLLIACMMPIILVACHGTRIDGMYRRWRRVSATWKIALNLWMEQLFRRSSTMQEVLELRSRASEELNGLLSKLEGLHNEDSLKDQDLSASTGPCKFVPGLVDWYRSCGAHLESS